MQKHLKSILRWAIIGITILIVCFTILDFVNNAGDTTNLQEQLAKMSPQEQQFCLETLGQITALSTERDVLALLGSPYKSLKVKKNWWVTLDGKRDRVGVYFNLKGYATQVSFDGGFGRFYYMRILDDNASQPSESTPQEQHK